MINSASMFLASDPTEPTARAAIVRRPSAAAGAARPGNTEVGPPVSLAGIASGCYRDDPPVKPHDNAPDEDEYLTLPDEVPEEVLEYSRPACHDRRHADLQVASSPARLDSDSDAMMGAAS
jgi:hypothetical protein